MLKTESHFGELLRLKCIISLMPEDDLGSPLKVTIEAVYPALGFHLKPLAPLPLASTPVTRALSGDLAGLTKHGLETYCLVAGWIHHCVYSIGGSCTTTVVGSIIVCVKYWRELYPTVTGSITVCLQYLKGAVPHSYWIHHCVCSVGGSCTPQLLDPSLYVQYWRELYPTVTGSITVCVVLEGAVPHSCWIHHCMYSIGGSCTPQLLDPSLCVRDKRKSRLFCPKIAIPRFLIDYT